MDRFGRYVRAFFTNDVVVTTVAITVATAVSCIVWVYLAYLSYEKRYGISFADFLEIGF